MHLSEVNTSARASITSFNDPDLELKLMEFGVAIGSQIVIQRRAPFGGPILIETQNVLLTKTAQYFFAFTENKVRVT